MKMRKSLYPWLLVSMSVVLFGLTACSNGNLFGSRNNRGSSGDRDVILTDAAVAFRERNFGAALQLYERVLTTDPNNSVALYGAASSAVGSAGVNLAQLLANISNQTSGITSLDTLIKQSRTTISASTVGGPDSLLSGINTDALDRIIDIAICRLSLIATGAADGTIAADDIDLLLNFGVLCLLRSILRPLRAGWLDIQNGDGDYSIEVDPAIATIACTDPKLRSFVTGIAGDITGAYVLINRVVNLLNLASGNVLRDIRDDIERAAELILPPGGPLPQVCKDLFTQIGLTDSTFKSNTDALVQLPDGCAEILNRGV